MNLISLPILIPLLLGILLLVFKGHRSRTFVAVLGSSVTLTVSVLIMLRTLSGEVLVLQMANWPAPFGISIVADGLTGVMLVLSSTVALLTVIFASSSFQHTPRRGQTALLNRARESFGAHSLLQFLFMGVHMSFLTGDLFNLFVSFEVMLIASYGLLLIGGEVAQLREGFKYVVINLIASAIFVVAAGFSYGLFGTLNMADVAQRLEGVSDPRVTVVALLLALVFATKAAVFPLGFWLPHSYPVPPAAISAYFGAILTKVGAYALIRSFTLMFPEQTLLQSVLLALAAVTMLIGGFGAIAQGRWRYLLSFANVASVGYIVMGTFIGSEAALSATLYYFINSVLVIFALFLIAGLGEKLSGQNYYSEGHLAAYPYLGMGFFIGVIALAGLPPMSGFIGKFGLVQALLADGGTLNAWVTGAAIVSSFLLLYAGLSIWRGFFWGENDAVHRVHLPRGMSFAAGAAVSLVIVLTVLSGPVYSATERVAAQLRNSSEYITAVLGNQATEEAKVNGGSRE